MIRRISSDSQAIPHHPSARGSLSQALPCSYLTLFELGALGMLGMRADTSAGIPGMLSAHVYQLQDNVLNSASRVHNRVLTLSMTTAASPVLRVGTMQARDTWPVIMMGRAQLVSAAQWRCEKFMGQLGALFQKHAKRWLALQRGGAHAKNRCVSM